jgi:hypothetical protein
MPLSGHRRNHGTRPKKVADFLHDDATLHPSSTYIAVYDLPKLANLKKLYPELFREQAVLVGDVGDNKQ